MLAFNRLIDDHLYWITVIQPRYCDEGDWQRYLRLIVGSEDISPEVQAFGDAWRAFSTATTLRAGPACHPRRFTRVRAWISTR